MSVGQLILVESLPALAVLLVALRVIWKARSEGSEINAEFAEHQSAFERHLAELDLAAANPGEPASTYVTAWRGDYAAEDDADEKTPESPVLQLTLDWTAPEPLSDLTQAKQKIDELVTAVSDYERANGGAGLNLTRSAIDRGRLVLTLRPRESSGAAERVKTVAVAVNAAFAAGRPSAALGPLPAGVSAAVAAETLAA